VDDRVDAIDSDPDGAEPLLVFDRNSRDFAMGFELGRLWEQLKTGEAFDQTIHAVNVEMVVRMREATGRDMRIVDVDETWCVLFVEVE
jgi:hypothetical protein